MANRYWVGDGGNWSSTTKWSDTSGGTSGASVPASSDNAIFDANSFSSSSQTITIDANSNCLNLDFSSVTNAPVLAFGAGSYLRVYGNIDIPSGAITTTGSSTKELILAGTGSKTIKIEVTLNANLVYGASGTYTFLSDINAVHGLDDNSSITADVGSGTLDLDGYDFSGGHFRFTEATTVISDESTITITDTNATSPRIELDTTSATLSLTTTDFIWMHNATGGSDSMDFDGLSIRSLEIDNTGGTVIMEVTDNGDIGTLQCTSGQVELVNNKRIGKVILNDGFILYLHESYVHKIYDWERTGTGSRPEVRATTLSSTAQIYTPGGSFTLAKIEFDSVELVGDATIYATSTAGASALNDVIGNIYLGKPTYTGSKRIVARIFDKVGGSLLKEYDSEIAEPPVIIQERQVPYHEVSLRLQIAPENADEEEIIVNNNVVKLFTIDNEAPNGVLVYTGFIRGYTTDYESDLITLMLRGYGADLGGSILQSSYTDFYSQTVSDSSLALYPVQADSAAHRVTTIVDKITTAVGTSGIDAVVIKAKSTNVYTADYTVSIHTSQSAARAGAAALGSASKLFFSQVPEELTLTFADTVPVSASTDYYVRVVTNNSSSAKNAISNNVYYDETTGGFLQYLQNGSWTTTDDKLYLIVREQSQSTTVTYTNQEVSEVVKDILDLFQAQGGLVDFSPAGIEATGTNITYTFNTNTLLEALHTLHGVVEASYYWYIDPATNLLYFREISSTETVTLNKTKDISSLVVDKLTDNIVSEVWFTGGDTGGGVYLYKKYTNQSTQDNYRKRAQRLVDGRVTVEATADKRGAAVLNNQGVPVIRAEVVIKDSHNSNDGYDIESITLSDVIRILGYGQADFSLYDVGTFDASYWDFNMAQIGTLSLQAFYKEYSLHSVRFWLDAVPEQFLTSAESTRRDFLASEVLVNPSEPS